MAEKQKHKRETPQKVYVDIELPNGEKDDDEMHEELEAEVEELADDLYKIQALVSGSYTASACLAVKNATCLALLFRYY